MAGCFWTGQKLQAVLSLICFTHVLVQGNMKEGYVFESHSCGHKHSADQVNFLFYYTAIT